ncbi:hypothetical protein [Pseudomonas tumuqii]|uniref:hypothetical protein n=1 Tax=Pseudomonas tumuqii TaxID=2715755 RepID=UPI001C49A819|nr:hypothetical protein [Pseudomonas tumuqii]
MPGASHGPAGGLGVVHEVLQGNEGFTVEDQATESFNTCPVTEPELLHLVGHDGGVARPYASDDYLQRQLGIRRGKGGQLLAEPVAPGTHGVGDINQVHPGNPLDWLARRPSMQ